jgi:hypothetical protein
VLLLFSRSFFLFLLLLLLAVIFTWFCYSCRVDGVVFSLMLLLSHWCYCCVGTIVILTWLCCYSFHVGATILFEWSSCFSCMMMFLSLP